MPKSELVSPAAEPATLTVVELAQMLRCSPRHIYRLCDRGAMPRPLRLGSLVRWLRVEIDAWLAAGCPKRS